MKIGWRALLKKILKRRGYEVDYEVHRKPQVNKSSTKDPCGDLFESWNDELGDWDP